MYNTLLWTFYRIGFDATLIKLSLRDILNQLHGFEIKTIVSSIKKHAGTRKAVKGD